MPDVFRGARVTVTSSLAEVTSALPATADASSAESNAIRAWLTCRNGEAPKFRSAKRPGSTVVSRAAVSPVAGDASAGGTGLRGNCRRRRSRRLRPGSTERRCHRRNRRRPRGAERKNRRRPTPRKHGSRNSHDNLASKKSSALRGPDDAAGLTICQSVFLRTVGEHGDGFRSPPIRPRHRRARAGRSPSCFQDRRRRRRRPRRSKLKRSAGPDTVPGALRVDTPAPSPVVPRGAPITFDFEGRTLRAFEGEPVAVALHAAGIKELGRSSKYHRPRGFFCLDGHCASCYLRIDGRPNRRACMTPVRAGLRCERQNAFPSADVDLLRAADWLFPEGMDHHTLMTADTRRQPPVPEAGAPDGRLGDAARCAARRRCRARATIERVDLCIVGGGPAGLAAARACAETAPRARVVLFDEQAELGGSLLASAGRPRARRGDGGGGPARRRAARERRDRDRVFPRGRRRRAAHGDGDGRRACWRW